MNIYLIGGLGADERLFARLDLGMYSTHYINWIRPQRGESIKQYASRLGSQIDRSSDFVLLGVSFGGMIAAELHEMYSAKQLIIVSSAKHYKELPHFYRVAGKLRLHKLIPNALLMNVSLSHYFFGCKSQTSKKLLHEILNDTDPHFFRWAIDTILCWKRSSYAKELVHIHGDKDYILPGKDIKTAHLIKEGGHFMVFDQAEEIAALIKQELSSLS